MPQFNEYAVVEVVTFADGRARVELLERLPVVEGQRIPSDRKQSDAKKLLKRMNDRGSAWVAEDALIAPEEGDLDLEARQRAWEVIDEFTDDVFEFIEDGDVTEVEETLRSVEQRDLDDEVRALVLLLDLVERHTGIEEDDLEGRASAMGETANVVRDRLSDDQSAYRNMLDSLGGGSLTSDRTTRLLSSLESTVTVMTVGYLINQDDRFAVAFRQHINLTDSADEALDVVSASLEAAESTANLITRDGKQKFKGNSLRDMLAESENALAREVARIALDAARDESPDSDSLDTAELLELAQDIASPFAGELDFDPVWGVVEAEFYEGIAQQSESELRAALNDGDLERASAAMNDFVRTSQRLGSLYARHDQSKLDGDNAKEHAELAGQRLFARVESQFTQAATAFLGSKSANFDLAMLAEREPRLRELVAPFNAALGREVLDDAFFHEAREQAKANSHRQILRVGQVWEGAILCGEATSLRQYRAGYNRRGTSYHGPERLALTLELTEAKQQGAWMRFQGKLTAQNLPNKTGWRHWDSEAGNWKRTERPASTQFVTLAYHPRLLTVELKYGVLDRASHIDKYGQSRYYTGNVEGTWHQFQGKGTMTPSLPMIEGRIGRRYIDDTCTEFSLAPSRSDDPPNIEPPTDSPIEPIPGGGALDRLTEQTYLGGVTKRGMKVFAMSASGDWCAENVVFKVEAESADVFSDGALDFYMTQFGKRINDEQFCPAARSVDLIGFSGPGSEPVYRGRATAHNGWKMQ